MKMIQGGYDVLEALMSDETFWNFHFFALPMGTVTSLLREENRFEFSGRKC